MNEYFLPDSYANLLRRTLPCKVVEKATSVGPAKAQKTVAMPAFAKYFLMRWLYVYEDAEVLGTAKALRASLKFSSTTITKAIALLVREDYLVASKISTGKAGRPSCKYSIGKRTRVAIKSLPDSEPMLWEVLVHKTALEERVWKNDTYIKSFVGHLLLMVLYANADANKLVRNIETATLRDLVGVAKVTLQRNLDDLKGRGLIAEEAEGPYPVKQYINNAGCAWRTQGKKLLEAFCGRQDAQVTGLSLEQICLKDCWGEQNEVAQTDEMESDINIAEQKLQGIIEQAVGVALRQGGDSACITLYVKKQLDAWRYFVPLNKAPLALAVVKVSQVMAQQVKRKLEASLGPSIYDGKTNLYFEPFGKDSSGDYQLRIVRKQAKYWRVISNSDT